MMNQATVLRCSGCGAALDVNVNQAFVYCKYCGAKNHIASQQMKSNISLGNVNISANLETDSLIQTAEYAISIGDLDKANEMLMSAVLSGTSDYRVYTNKAKIDLWTDDNGSLFESLEKLAQIENDSRLGDATRAIKELMSYRGVNGITALHNATFHERLDLVRFCVEHGADVNCVAGMNKVTPLTIMYVPMDSRAYSKLDGTPFVRNKENVKQIREYLISHGAKEKRGDVRRLKKSKGINKVIYCLLAIFAGAFGAHKFYAGKIVSGILYLLFFITGISSILALVDLCVAFSIPSDDTGRIRV